MNDEAPLYRQIVPSWLVNGRPSSQAFRPFDGDSISVYDGDMITAEGSYIHYTEELGNLSAGVASLSVYRFKNEGLTIIEDREPYKEHISVDFSNIITNSKRRSISKRLADASHMDYIPN